MPTNSTTIPIQQLPDVWTHLPGFYWVVNDALAVVGVSQQYLDLVKQVHSEVLYRDVARLYRSAEHLLPDGGLSRLRGILKEVQATKQEVGLTNVRFNLHDSDYPDTTYNLLFRPVTDAEQKVVYIIHQTEVQPPSPIISAIGNEKFQNSGRGIVFIQSRQGRVLDANAAAEQLLGLSRDELLQSKAIDSSWQPIGRDGNPRSTELPISSRVLAGEVVRNQVVVFCHPQLKERRWLLVEAAPQFQLGEQEPFQAIITFTDITEKRRAEEALRQSEEQYRSLVQATTDTVWTTNAKGEVVEDSPSWRNFTGQTYEERKGYGWVNAVHPDDRAFAEQQWREAVSREAPVDTFFRLRHTSGEWRQTAVRAVPLRNLDGSLRGYIGTNTDITQRKLAEEVIQESEIYRSIATNLPHAAVFVLDTHLRYLVAEGQALETAGMTSADLEGKLLSEALNDELVAQYESYFRQALAGEPFCLEHRSHNRWFVSNGVPLRKNQGEVYALLAVSYDITERKRAEQALRKSEEKYHTLFESIDEGFCIIKMLFNDNDHPIDYRFLEVNPAFKVQTGLFDVVGKRVSELAPNLEKHWCEIYGRVALTGNAERFTRQASYLGKLCFDVYAFRVGQSEERKVAVLFNNITERKQAEQALQKSEERFRLASQAGETFSWELDISSLQFEYAGDVRSVLGLSNQEEPPQTLDEMLALVHQEDRKRVEQELEQIKQQADTYTLTFRIRPDKQETIWIEKQGRVLRNEQGDVQRVMGVGQNVTRKKQAEAALRQAKEEAEEAARAKEGFLAHMSHEIRTPLNAVLGISNLLLQENPRPDQQENLQTLHFSAENLRVLVNDILDFSKLRAGKMEINAKAVHLRRLLTSLQKAHQSYALDKGNELRVQFDERLPEWVRTDQLKLSQVLHNLVGNAMKFTQQGIVEVKVSLNRREGSALWIDFSVSDTGMGIPSEKLPAIFDAFTQVNKTTVSKTQGTGLGLSITKLLLELMDSQIEVESQEGSGSRFFFTLPAQEASAGESSPDAPVLSTDKTEQMSKLKVLLVEDVAVNRMICNQLVKGWWNLTLDEAEQGEQAVEMVQKKPYDLILMDVRMPVMDGYLATRIIRELPDKRYAEIPILALTADTAEEIKKHPEATLFTDVIIKPFDPQDLQRKMARYI